jgi:hypothetical protein
MGLVNRPIVTRLDLWTISELKGVARENDVSHSGLSKIQLFDHLDALGFLPY